MLILTIEDIELLIRQKDYKRIKNAIDQGHIPINIKIKNRDIFTILLQCPSAICSIGCGNCRIEHDYFIKYIPSNFIKYMLIDKGYNSLMPVPGWISLRDNDPGATEFMMECSCLNINDIDFIKQNILENCSILIKSIRIEKFIKIIISFIEMLYFDILFFKSIINIFINNGLIINHITCFNIIDFILMRYDMVDGDKLINIQALSYLFEYGKCAESLSQDTVLKKKFDNIKLFNNSMQKAIYLKFKNNIDSLYELIFMPADNKIIISDDLKTFAIKDQISLKHEILINKDMSKIINVIKSRYYDLLFELIELININTYIYGNEVYKTILILAVENYAKDKQFDKMLILYLLKTANPNLCAYRQGIVEKIYYFNYTPVQLMIKHEDFDLILAMIEN